MTDTKTDDTNLEDIMKLQSKYKDYFYIPSRNCGRKYIYDLMNNDVKERLSKKQ